MNQQLQTLEHNSQRILTTQQIAEAYDATPKVISQNFTRNKEHYIEGKHYFFLEGEELKLFKNSLRTTPQIEDNIGVSIPQFEDNIMDKKAPSLYLWTEKGAFLHAKSLNTDKAWAAYEMLVDEYYRLRTLSLQGFGLGSLEYLDQIIEKQQEVLRGYRKVKHQERKRLGLVVPHTPQQNDLPPQELLLKFLQAQPVPVTIREITQYGPLGVRRLKAGGIRVLLIEMQAIDLVTIETQGKAVGYQLVK